MCGEEVFNQWFKPNEAWFGMSNVKHSKLLLFAYSCMHARTCNCGDEGDTT